MEITSYQPGTPNWVDLGSPDPEATAAFYGSLFGWDIQDAGPADVDTGGYRMCLRDGHPVAGIGGQEQPGPPYWTTYVSVADVDAATKAVEVAGGQTVVGPMDVMRAGRMAVFADPAGAPFSVWQPKDHIGAGLVNEPGTVCWNELATRDTDAAATFYGDVFGWGGKGMSMGGFTYTEWQLDGRSVGGMMPMGDMFPPEVPPHWTVYFAVADTDATVARVRELGGTVMMEPDDAPPGRLALVADPHGATFGLIALANPVT
jgi:hypothetical protein